MKKMTKSNSTMWEILVPKYANAGFPYTLSHHKDWDNKVKSISGGMTLKRTVKGTWISPNGTEVADVMIPVQVVCSKSSIRKIIKFTKTHYKQEKVLAYKVSSEVLLE